MIAASYAAPGPGGVWRFDASRETQTFGASTAAFVEETRTRAGVEIGNWIDQRTRVSGGAAGRGWRDRARPAGRSSPGELSAPVRAPPPPGAAPPPRRPHPSPRLAPPPPPPPPRPPHPP